MRKLLIFLFHLVLVILVATSCGGGVAPDVREFKLEKTDYKDWAKLLDVESVAQLQENDSNLMSFALKCIFTNDCIVFWEYKAKKSTLFRTTASSCAR